MGSILQSVSDFFSSVKILSFVFFTFFCWAMKKGRKFKLPTKDRTLLDRLTLIHSFPHSNSFYKFSTCFYYSRQEIIKCICSQLLKPNEQLTLFKVQKNCSFIDYLQIIFRKISNKKDNQEAIKKLFIKSLVLLQNRVYNCAIFLLIKNLKKKLKTLLYLYDLMILSLQTFK